MKILIFTILFNVLNYVNGVNYTPAAISIFEQMAANGSEPTKARKEIINQLVKDLQGTGNYGSFNVWGQLDILNLYAAEDEPQALTEFIQQLGPGVNDTISINNPAFTSNLGFQISSSAYLKNGLIPSNANNYGLNSATVGGYFYNITSSYLFFIGNGSQSIFFRANAGSVDFAINSPLGYSQQVNTTPGYKTINRDSNTNVNFYNDTTLANNSTLNSVNVSNSNLSIRTLGGFQNIKCLYAGSGNLKSHLPQLQNSINNYFNSI